MINPQRFHRNQLLFGVEGQARLRACHVSVAGVGGLGSHVVQQLAYLGVGKLTLVDHDRVEGTNLNRLVGANTNDADRRLLKVDVAKRATQQIYGETSTVTISDTVQEPVAQEAICQADIVVGCLDDDASRLFLTELCSRNQIPYLDLASDIGSVDERPWYGGRVFFGEGRGCLSCMQLLDQRAIRHASVSAEQLEQEARIYGVPAESLGLNTGPAVVSINGVVASLGVTELMVAVTGLRAPFRLLTYRGDLGRVSVSLDEPAEDCYYCTQLWDRTH